MNTTDLFALLPLLLTAGTAVMVMVAIAVVRNHALSLWITLIGLAASFASLGPVARLAPHRITELLILDRYSIFYFGLILAATFAVSILCYSYLKIHTEPREELYVLLCVAALGSMVLAASGHFASFFLGLEILSVALYALSAYLHNRSRSVEAGMKYLVLAGSSSAFLLFGMALLYAQMGAMDLSRIAAQFRAVPHSPLSLVGLVLITTGIGFKLGVVPFHLWTPDVYEGAPAPVTAFIATVSKGAMFALLLRYFYSAGAQSIHSVFVVFAIIAIASMIVGNLLALLQRNVKRILAYSSIAHMGYLLVAFEAGGDMAPQAVAFYLVAYFITTLGAFGVISVLSQKERDADALADYRGLFWRRPVLASIFTVMLFSLAGIPLTAGFLAKFYVVAAAVSGATWVLVFVLVTTSVVGLFYYLRVMVTMYARTTEPFPASTLFHPAGAVLIALTVLLVWFGVYPSVLLNLVKTALPT